VPRVAFDTLVTMMVDADLALAERDRASAGVHVPDAADAAAALDQ
jgi:hypothetical protein